MFNSFSGVAEDFSTMKNKLDDAWSKVKTFKKSPSTTAKFNAVYIEMADILEKGGPTAVDPAKVNTWLSKSNEAVNEVNYLYDKYIAAPKPDTQGPTVVGAGATTLPEMFKGEVFGMNKWLAIGLGGAVLGGIILLSTAKPKRIGA